MRVEGKELALRTTRKDYQAEANDMIFSLSVPNQLLYQCHRMVKKPRDYIPPEQQHNRSGCSYTD